MVDSSADAIGDMSRTSDAAANRWKQFQANIEDFSASLGKLILPTLNAVLGELNKSLKELNLILNSPQAKFASLGERYVELQREKQKMLQTIKDAEETVGNRYQQFLNRGNLDYAKKRLEAINAEIAEIETKADAIYPKAVKDTGESKVGEINKVSLTKDDFKKVTDEVEKSAKRANDEIKKLQDEVAKLEESYKEAVAFSGDDSNYERMQAQLRSGAQISQMESERLKYLDEEYNKAFETENERLMERVRLYEQANQSIIEAEKRRQEIMNDTMNIMSQNFSDAFADVITGTQSVEKAFTAMINSIISGLVRMSTQRGFEQIFGMLMTGLPSLFGGGAANLPINQPGFPGAATFHSGGVVGASGGAVRNIPMAAFSFAPRLHNGLMPDEYPAVLQKGERVIPRGGGAGNNITINIAAPNGRVDRESISAMRAGLFAELNRQAMRNS
jgi:chromosome segregation ATPase